MLAGVAAISQPYSDPFPTRDGHSSPGQEPLHLLGRGFLLLRHKKQPVRTGRKRHHIRRMVQRGKINNHNNNFSAAC